MSLQDSLTRITTDTGEFALGRQSFATYTTPGMCRMAAVGTRDVLRRSLVAQERLEDAIRYDWVHDTLPREAVQVARACGRRFTVATVPARQLEDLFYLALLEQDDTLAEAVLTRRLALLKTPAARVGLLDTTLGDYLGAEPARVAAAERLIVRLDGLGPSAQVVPLKIQSYARLLQFGKTTLDAVLITQAADHILALARPLSPRALGAVQDPVVKAYQALMALAFTVGSDSVQAVAQRALTDMHGLQWQNPNGRVHQLTSVDQALRELAPEGATATATRRPAPRLHAAFWYPAGADTVQPAAGHVSVLVGLPGICIGADNGGNLLDPIQTGCSRLYRLLRRWQQQYGAAGFTVTLMGATQGYSLLSGPETSTEEAANLWWYIHDYLHLPVQLAVQQTKFFAPLPAPDNRVLRAPDTVEARMIATQGKKDVKWTLPPPDSLQNELYWDTYKLRLPGRFGLERDLSDVPMVLTDRTGAELYAGGLTPLAERLLARELRGMHPGPPTAAQTP